ncbi:MAG: metallophosphoesterase [Kiritimatiellae bacterium]|nr:metallophosphoesterase [Kiritimatiellia bacterium]MDD5523049.1 metallophosphoesterase [Kiritimatiellia bacterium]
MKTVVLSDLHIGSRYFMHGPLKSLLDRLPENVDLVFNGDTVDRRRRRLTPIHQESLTLIQQESQKRRVIWIWGNHDWKYKPPDRGKIEFVRNYNIGKRLFLSHGHNFDFIMPFTRPLIVLIRLIHDLRVDLGAERVHVAFAAKRFAGLYRVLRQHITKTAVKFARKNGYETVACGHTHYVEDIIIDGIRYINTGSWTEAPICCLFVNGEKIELIQVEQIISQKRLL